MLQSFIRRRESFPARQAIFRFGLLLGMMSAIAACTPTVSQNKPEPTTGNLPTESPAEPLAELPGGASAETPSDTSAPVVSDIDDEQCDDPQTQQAMNQCADQDYKRADAALNQVYQQIQSQLSDSGQHSLTDVELTWISFRDLECDFASDQFEGGSIAPLIYSSCLESYTELRTAELSEPQLPEQSYETADAQLNQAYQELLAQLRASRSEDFVTVQLAWLDYRDRNCDFEVLYGAVPIEESQCLARMSTIRTDQILDTLEQNSL